VGPRVKVYHHDSNLRILFALKKEPLKVKELAHKLLMAPNRTRAYLEELADQGLAVKDSQHRWHTVVRFFVTDPLGQPEAPAVALEELVLGQTSTEPQPDVPGANMAAARYFRVPARLNAGVLTVGKAGPCSECRGETPLRYGTKYVCVDCARIWRD